MKLSKDIAVILKPVLTSLVTGSLPEILEGMSEFSAIVLQKLTNLISNNKRLDGEGYLLGLYTIVMYQADSIKRLETSISEMKTEVEELYRIIGSEK